MITTMKAPGGTHKSISFTVRDPYSALTHFIGIIYSIMLMPVILSKALYLQADRISVLSIAVFLSSMILLYTASTLYHTFGTGEQQGMFFKKLDHCMIFLLIAGTYTPVCLIALRDEGGIPLLVFVWLFAIAGVVFKLFWVTNPKWISSVLYIGMGWSCIFALPTLYRVLTVSEFSWLLAGGLLYTIGGVLYALKLSALNHRLREFGSHEIFHVFVMLGNLAHFICVWKLVG